MKTLLIFASVAVLGDAWPGYSASSNSENDIGRGSGGASSYGYSGSYAGSYPQGQGGGQNFPSFPVFQPFDFAGFFDALNRQHQEFLQRIQKLAQGYQQQGYATGNYAPGYQGTYNRFGGAGAGAGGSAGSFSSAGGYGGGFGLGNRGGFVGGYGGGFSGPDGQTYTFSGPIGEGSGAAVASGSIGPGGIHQTAQVYPENPGSPNINTRFGGSSSGGDGGGFKSVFTSSKSVSTNVDGRPQTFREASTTVNDNGKVTTYTAHNP